MVVALVPVMPPLMHKLRDASFPTVDRQAPALPPGKVVSQRQLDGFVAPGAVGFSQRRKSPFPTR
jgi:hypothetical protein